MVLKISQTILWALIGVTLSIYGAYTLDFLPDTNIPIPLSLWLSGSLWFCVYGILAWSFLDDIWNPEEREPDEDSRPPGAHLLPGIYDFEDWLDNRDMVETTRAYVKSLTKEYTDEITGEAEG